MRTGLIYTLLLLFGVSFLSLNAQTKPKTKTKTKTTAKTPAKTPAKTAAVKKPAESSGYVCTSSKDKFYHKRSSCGALSKCPETIKFCATQAELAKWKRKRCQRCYNM
jgi:hypothetical protein